MCLCLIVSFSLILYVSEVNGVQTSPSGPVLACHVPLEVKIFADSSYQALSADLKSCTQITLSSVNALFLPSSNTSLVSLFVSEKRSLELLRQQTPEAEFSFSLRSTHTSPATWNLKTIFNRTTSVAHLVEFLRANKLKSFDIAWDLIQSAPDYGPQLKSLKTTLRKEGFNLTTTIGVEVDRIDAFHVTRIASIVDRIFLVSSYNRHYSGSRYPLTEKKVEQAFDALELNEAAFLKLYSTLNLSWKKIIIGLSLQTLVWKLSLGTIVGTQYSQYQAILQLQSYYESCKTVNSTWRLQQQPNPFYQFAVAPTNDQWMIHVDPLTLSKRVDLLKQYGFGGVALYDYYQDDFAGICNSKGKMYPLIQQAGQSIRNISVAVPFPDVDTQNGLCIPFLGLTNECKGAFNFGKPKISIDSVEFTNISTSSAITVTRTTLPFVNDSTTTRVPPQYTTENVTIPSSLTREATIALPASWAQVADAENLVRTRRSSVSSGELGTEPSYSYLKPPGFNLVDVTPRVSSSNSKAEFPALKSVTTTSVSANLATEASKEKVELSGDNQTQLSDTFATTLSPALESREKAVTSKLLLPRLEMVTAVEEGGAVSSISTSLPELGILTETEQTVTHLQNPIESNAPDALLTLSTSEIDRATDFPIVSSSQAGIDSSVRTEMESATNFDPQVETTADVLNYASNTREDMTNFMDGISNDNAIFDITVSPAGNHNLPNAERPSSVLGNNENTIAPEGVEPDLYDSSTTRPQTFIDQGQVASSQYYESLDDLLEQTTSELSSLLTADHLESSTVVPIHSATFDTTVTKYEAPVLQDLVLTSVQQLTDDDETASFPTEMISPEPERSTTSQPINPSEETFSSESPSQFSFTVSNMQASSSEISIENLITTLSPQALFSSTAKEIFTKDIPVSDIFPAISLLPFDPVDPVLSASATSATEEQERHLHLSSASSSSVEETQSTLNTDFSTAYDSSSLEVDADVQPEDSFSIVTSSVPEWNATEETFSNKTNFLHSTVFDASPVKEYRSEFQGATGTDSPETIFDNQFATEEWLSIVEERSTESSPVTSIEETPFSIHIDQVTAQTAMFLDASTAAIELANSDFTAPGQNSVFGNSKFETTVSSITDSNPIQFTEPSEEAFSGESATPYSTTSIGDEMTDVSTGYEAKSPIVSPKTSLNEESVIDQFSPTTWQTSTEKSFPTSTFDGISSELESIPPIIAAGISSTFLKPISTESSTERQHFGSSLTFLEATVAETNPSSSETHISLEIGDSEVMPSVPDWNSHEVFTQSAFLSSTSINVEMTEAPAVSDDGISAVPSATSLDEQSSVPQETSTEIHFSPSISNEFHQKFEAILPPNLAGNAVTFMEDTQTINAIDSSTLYSPILPDITAASTKLMDEENEVISSTTGSLHLEDSQSNLPMDEEISSLIPIDVGENNEVDTAPLMEISEPTESVLESSNLEDYIGEISTSSAVMSSDEQFATLDFSPSDTGTIPEGSPSMFAEFSGTSELSFNLADTSAFSIPTELSTSHLNILSGDSVTFTEDTRSFTREELSSSFFPVSRESTSSGTALMDNEEDPFSSTTSRYLEDLQSNMPIEKTFSTSVPFDMSVPPNGSFDETLMPLELEQLTSFESSLSTASPPISGGFQLLDTDVTIFDEELLNQSSRTPIFENENLEDSSLLIPVEDGSGSTDFLIATGQPSKTVSISEIGVTFNPINLFSSSLTNELLERVEDSLTNDIVYSPSTEITGTSKSSIANDIFSNDVSFGTSVPNAASADLILDPSTIPSSISRPSTLSPILDMDTVSSVLTPDDNTMAGSGEPMWDNTFSGSSGPFLDPSSSLTHFLEDAVSTDPRLPYALVNMDVVSSSESYDGEIFIASAATSSDELFSSKIFSPSVAGTLAQGSSLTSDQFSETSGLPFDFADTTAFFIPTESPTNHPIFVSENLVTFSEVAQTLTDEELSPSFLPILPDVSTSVIELTDGEKEVSSRPTTSVYSQPNALSEENYSSPIPYDMSDSPGGYFEQTLTPLQTNPLVVVTDSLTSASRESVGPSGQLSEDVVSSSPSTAEPMSNESQLLGTKVTTPDEKVAEFWTVAPSFENEGSAENSITILEEDGSGATPGFLNATAQPNQKEDWILILEEEGSGAITPGFLNATDQPSHATDSISEIDLTISGVHLSVSSPATSIAETHETGAVTSSIESTSVRGLSDNSTGQELVKDSFANTAIGFSGTMDLSPLTDSSTEMSIALTSPPTSDILMTENPSSVTLLPINVTGSDESKSTSDVTTSLPPLPPNVPLLSSSGPIFELGTVSLKPSSAYNMMASPTEMWYTTPSESSGSSLSSSGLLGDSLSLLTSPTEIKTPSTSASSFTVTSEALLASPTPATLGRSTLPPLVTSSPAALLSSSPSSPALLTTFPDTVTSSSTSSASPTSNFSDITASTTVPPIINLWNLLISRITTADKILSLIKNSTSGSSSSDSTTSILNDENLKGTSTSSVPSTTGNSEENSVFVTRPFWLMIRPSPDSPPVFSASQALPEETTPTPVAISRMTTSNTEVPVSTSGTTTFTHSDLFLTRPVWLQGSTGPSKLTTNISTPARFSSTRVSPTTAFHAFTSKTTTSMTDAPSTKAPLSTSSSSLNLPTTLNAIGNDNSHIRNCTEHVGNSPSSIASVTNAAAYDVVVQLNGTADTGNEKRTSSFHFEKWLEALNLLVASNPEIKGKEIQSSAICDAARNSILLKSLFCSYQSSSAMKEKRFANLMQIIRRLAPAIIANLTTTMNLEVKKSVNVTEFDIDGSSTTPSRQETSTESSTAMSIERSTRSTILMQHSTESFLLNLSTTLLNNVSPVPTVVNITLESLMENLEEQLKEAQLADVITAVNRLSHNIPEGFLESLIQNNSSDNGLFFSLPGRVEVVKEDMINAEEQTTTSSTTIPTTEVHDVLQKDFWKTNRRNPVKTLQRFAGTGGRTLPTNGRYWWDTTKPVSSIFRPFAKPGIGRG